MHKAFLCYVTVNFQFDFNGVQPLGSTLLSVGTVILLLFPVISKVTNYSAKLGNLIRLQYIIRLQ